MGGSAGSLSLSGLFLRLGWRSPFPHRRPTAILTFRLLTGSLAFREPKSIAAPFHAIPLPHAMPTSQLTYAFTRFASCSLACLLCLLQSPMPAHLDPNPPTLLADHGHSAP